MRIDKLEPLLYKLYNAGKVNRHRKSILILGPPGTGKSLTVYRLAQRIAKNLGKKFVDYNDDLAQEILANPEEYFVYVDFLLNQCEPSDLIGIPRRGLGNFLFLVSGER